MPAQQRRRSHERRSRPRLAWQHPVERRQQRPISLRQLGTSDLTLEHMQLVAKEKDLDLLLALRTTPKHGQLQQPPQRPVQKRQNHASSPTRHRG